MEKLDSIIHFKTAIKSDAKTIYDLISTANGWDSWFTRGMIFNLEKNGEVLFSWKDWSVDKVNESERAVVLDFIPNKYLKFLWNFFIPEGPTTVELIITPRVNDTVLEVIQSGFHNTKAGLNMFTQCSTGWAEALTLLKFYIEHGVQYN